LRVAVMGSGGLGGLFGGLLSAAGAEVIFIARGKHLDAMRSTGLRILSDRGDVSLDKVDATDDPKGRPLVDIVIFTVKGQDTKSAAALIEPVVGPDTAIVSFQNGVEWLDILSTQYSPDAVMPGATMTPATIEAPGVIRHIGGSRAITIGEWHGNKSARVSRFAECCEKAGLEVTISEKIHVDVWSKFVAMTSFSALACLTRLPLRTIAATDETRQLATDAMNEIIAISRARGVVLADDLTSKIFASVEKFDPSWKTSMCNDLEAGKPIEVDSLSGAVHRLGLELGVPTPVHSVAYRALISYARIEK